MLPKNVKIPSTDHLVADYLKRAQLERQGLNPRDVEEGTTLIKNLFYAIVLFAYKTLIVTQGWAWFVRPFIPAAPPLYYWTAAGLLLLWKAASAHAPKKASEPPHRSYGAYALALVITHGFLFGFHWLS